MKLLLPLAKSAACVLSAPLLLGITRGPGRPTGQGGLPTPLTREEAEILIYITPAGKSLRDHGFDIEWDPSDVMVHPTRVSLHAYGSRPPATPGGSVSAGNFSVDRYTAEVRVGDDIAHSSELDGVERIMLAGHHLPLPNRLLKIGGASGDLSRR